MALGARIAVTAREILCETCHNRVRVQIYMAGLADWIVFTCNRDSTVLTLSTWNKTLDSVVGGYPNSGLTDGQIKTIEAQLKPCPCGGTFKHDAKPKCPNCSAVLYVPDGIGRSAFIVVHRMIDGDKENPWRAKGRNHVQVS